LSIPRNEKRVEEVNRAQVLILNHLHKI
jgi:hypothetical protein